jgi:hypothetical protein
MANATKPPIKICMERFMGHLEIDEGKPTFFTPPWQRALSS